MWFDLLRTLSVAFCYKGVATWKAYVYTKMKSNYWFFFHKKNCNKLNNSLNIPGTTDASRGEGVVTIPWTTDVNRGEGVVTFTFER